MADADQTGLYDVATLARLAGIMPRTVRDYVRAKVIPKPPARGPATRYGDEHLVRIRAARYLLSRDRMTLAEVRARFAKMTLAQIEALVPRWEAPDAAPVEPVAPSPGGHVAPDAPNDAATANTGPLGDRWERVELFPGLELLMRSGSAPFIERIAREIRDRYGVR